MFLLAAIAGIASGFVTWAIAARWIAVSIAWMEDRRPHLVGSRQLRAAEVAACGTLFLACLALAIWTARIVWLQMK